MSEVKAKKANPAVEYFQESFMEMKKVAWPTRNQAVRLTLLVLGFCVVAAIVIGAVDAVFSFGHQKLIDYAATVNPAPVIYQDTATLPVTLPATADGSAQPATTPTSTPISNPVDVKPAPTATSTDSAPAVTTPTVPVTVPQQ